MAQKLSIGEIRDGYRRFLEKQEISASTVQTSCSDAFYLWRVVGDDEFWSIIGSDDWEDEARQVIESTLSHTASKNVTSRVNGYIYHLRRFLDYWKSDNSAVKAASDDKKTCRTSTDTLVPTPSVEQVDFYLKAWDELENYRLQETALDKLFIEMCPQNTDITDILLKVSTLNDFYSANIFSVFPVAKHILEIGIDDRLKAGDVDLVNDIKQVTINGKEKCFYSFASKYCSHHNPIDFPIYDSYVDKVLRYFIKRDGFAQFENSDLKDYALFKKSLIDFRHYYKLERYNLKEIDKYIWQLGKEFFPKNY